MNEPRLPTVEELKRFEAALERERRELEKDCIEDLTGIRVCRLGGRVWFTVKLRNPRPLVHATVS